jgi:hypothetical protein
MRNDLPERSARGRSKFSAENYVVHFDEKAYKEKLLKIKK